MTYLYWKTDVAKAFIGYLPIIRDRSSLVGEASENFVNDPCPEKSKLTYLSSSRAK